MILADEIARLLRHRILRGDIAPGARVTERDWGAELGVSRTPMREAVRMLASEGLIELRPGRSPRVANPSYQEVADQVLVLNSLESLSAELACERAEPADLEVIRVLNDRMRELYADGDPVELFETDMNFHMAIARAAHSEALAETHHAYIARLWRARFMAASQHRNRKVARDQHEAILAALESHDRRAVRAAIGRHLKRLSSDIQSAMEQEEAARAAEQS